MTPLHVKTSAFGASLGLALLFCFLPLHSTRAADLPTAVVLSTGEFNRTVPQTTLASWFHLETRAALDRSRKNEILHPESCLADALYCTFSLSRETRSHLVISLSRDVDQESVKKFLNDFSKEVDQEPVNARFDVDETGAVVVKEAEKYGVKLDEAESLATLLRALESDENTTVRVRLTGVVDRPKIVGTDIARLGLKEIIGEGKTDFRGSPKNRVWNINRALKQYDGILIAPGEIFSFVEYLGEVDGEHGYLPELVIKNNKTEPEFGGGICQVSSTVFRAAIYSGLKITERRNHSYPVAYYKPYGMDATIYIPKPDLQFENNTPGYILMQPVVTGTTLTFQFYGTKDGRKVSVDGPHILESNPDGSMKTVFTQMVSDTSGESFIKDSFWSNYKSPSLFPHPGDEIFKSKPEGWSSKQWDQYKRTHGV